MIRNERLVSQAAVDACKIQARDESESLCIN